MLHKYLTKKYLLLGLGLGYISFKSLSYLNSLYIESKLSKKAKAKFLNRNSSHPVLPEISESIQLRVLSLTANELAKAIRSREITSTEAVSTYILRAYTLGREYSLTAEENFASALAQAQRCDDLLSKGTVLGVLHGVPISVKDHISQLGCTSSAGVAWRLDYPDTETAVLLELLEKEGAILFVRSNVSQAIMWIETSNQTYGKALNPWNHLRTTGGSSGGEGGLIACRASPLGIGSDIGGSLRTPCAFCGVYGFRPTPQRICFKGLKTAFKHNFEPLDCIISESLGPMGRCVDDLVLVMQIWWSNKLFNIDKSIPPLVFDQKIFENSNGRLKIGYFFDLPYFDAAPCIKKTIRQCVAALGEHHEIVEFQVPHSKEIIQLFMQAANANGSNDLLEALQGETVEPYYNLQVLTCAHPLLTSFALKLLKLAGNSRTAEFLSAKPNISPAEYIEVFQRIQDLTEILTAHWTSQSIDAIICPVFGLVAPNHNTTVELLPALSYSCIWNAVGYPTGIVPVKLVSAGEDIYYDKYNDITTKAAKKCMQGSEGLPIALQIVALPYKDELLLGVMKLVENIFQFHKHPI